MLDEKKIRRMVRLASYEAHEGKEEIEISAYHKRDYASVNVIRTLLWVTFGYVILAALVCFSYMEALIENITMEKIMAMAGIFLVVYLVIFIFYWVVAAIHYRKKHDKARENAKEFCRGLHLLEKMYEKENM